MFLIANDSMTGGAEHGTFGLEDAVFATALLVVVMDDKDFERSRHGVEQEKEFKVSRASLSR